jgi:hypothetical protein
VTGEEIERGAASEVFGLVLCGPCRERFHGEDRVELYFCGECGVSVPLFRVETGEAVEGDGRILCLECRAARRRPKVRRISILVAALFLVLAWFLRPAAPGPPVGPGSARLIGELLPAQPPDAIPRERLEVIDSRILAIASRRPLLEEVRDLALAAIEEANTGLLLGQEEFRRRIEALEELRRELARRLDELEPEAKRLNPDAGDYR